MENCFISMIDEIILKIREQCAKTQYWEIILVFLLLSPFLIFGILYKGINFGDKLSNLVLLITFGAIFWYSIETRGLKLSSKLNNELEQRPIINLYLKNSDNRNREHFSLRNIGKGVAYDIEVESIELDGFRYKFWFNQANTMLAPGSERPLKMITHTSEGGVILHDVGNFKSHFFSSSLKVEELNKCKMNFAPFLVSYKNIVGRKYYSLFKFYSKHPLTEEYTIEFIKSDKGTIGEGESINLCGITPTKETIFENR